MKKYIVVGGNPFRSYTGTEVCTGLRVVDTADSKEECEMIVRTHYEECGGLMLVVDAETGEPAKGV